MRLSKNFTAEEFTRSDKAIELGIVNSMTETDLFNVRALIENVLQPARDAYGKPITITSGKRIKELNDAIGGSPTSDHLDAAAADIWCPDLQWLFDWIRDNVEYDQLIWEYGRWIHVSYRFDGNRNQIIKYD